MFFLRKYQHSRYEIMLRNAQPLIKLSLADHRQDPCQPCSCTPVLLGQGINVAQHAWAGGLSTSLVPPSQRWYPKSWDILWELILPFSLPKQLIRHHVVTCFLRALPESGSPDHWWPQKCWPQKPPHWLMNLYPPRLSRGEVTRVAHTSIPCCQHHLLLVLEIKWKICG